MCIMALNFVKIGYQGLLVYRLQILDKSKFSNCCFRQAFLISWHRPSEMWSGGRFGSDVEGVGADKEKLSAPTKI